MRKSNKKFTQGKTVQNSFTGHRITKYSGLNPIVKYSERTHFGKQLLKVFPNVVENASQFSDIQLIQMYIFAMVCKVNRLSHIETFSTDPLVKVLLGLKRKVSDSSLSDRFRGFGESKSRGLEEFGLKENRAFLAEQPLARLTIDMDSTVSMTYGNQEGAEKGYNPNKPGGKSYHPLLAFVSEYKLVLHTWFRPGNCYTSNGSKEFVKQVIGNMPENIKKLFFRMDSGFFDNQLLYGIEQAGHDYLVKVKFKGLDQCLKLQQWQAVKGFPDVSICEFKHSFTVLSEDGQKLQIERPLKAIRTRTIQEKGIMGEEVVKYAYACYCSNLEGVDALQLHECYKPRATSENWIEQVKNQLLAGKTLIDDFWANDIFWQLSVLAYNLSVRMRTKVKKYISQEYNTFREWFVALPGVIVESGRRVFLKMYSHYHERKKWEEFDALINTV